MAPADDDRDPAWRRYLRLTHSNSAGDVDDELAFHLQSTIDEYVASGMTREAATAAARRKFGDVDGISRTLYTLSEQRERTMDRGEWWTSLRQDVVFGLRQLRKSPAFTIVAMITLALGIGANSAIFSVVYSVLLHPLPYAHADRIVQISQIGGRDTLSWVPHGNYLAWRARSADFVDMGATWGIRNRTLTGSGEPTPIPVVLATASYFKAMFIPPLAGRYYTDEEDRDGAAPVAVISEALWQSRFGSSPDVIGSTINLDSRTVRIVGVAPADYVLTPPAERMWMPLAPPAARFTDYTDHELQVYGLLKPGVAASVAAAHLKSVETPFAQEHPHSGYDGQMAAVPVADTVLGPQKSNLYMLLGAVSLVLLIACGNIANLLLARASVRRGEIAIRGALGASRPRIVTQLLVESVLLAAGGALLGLVVAYVGMRFLVTSPAAIPRLQSTTLNLPVLLFTLALAIACSVIFGLVPALRAARTDLQQTLRDGGRESRTAARERLRGALVVCELCVAQVLLIGAGLLIRSSMMVQSVPAGFDTTNLLAVSVGLPRAKYEAADDWRTAFDQLEFAIRSVPGVKSVAYSQVAPIYGNGYNWTVFREGSNGHDDGSVTADMRMVNADYFSTLGIRLVRGRAFTRADGPTDAPVAIISRGLAKRLFGDADPIGKRISNGSVAKPDWKEIVGVADDIHGNGLANAPFPALYIPALAQPNPGMTFMIRGNASVTTLVPAIRRAVASVDPLLPLARVSTMEEAIGRQLALPRFNMYLLALLGATGLVLAIVGVYGVVGYFVTQRRHEIGVRLALGASTGAVQALVVKQGLLFAGVGILLGIPLALMATRLLRSFMFGITAHDPLTFAAVAAILGLVTIAASYVPARRATRIDPLEALRSS
jgi:predicted permease